MTSDKQLRCGIEKLHTGPDDPFIAECIIHDKGYAQGGNPDRMVRVDKEFYRGMFRKALRKPWLLPRASLYTLFVMLGGRWVWDAEPEAGWVADKPSLGLVTDAVVSNLRRAQGD